MKKLVTIIIVICLLQLSLSLFQIFRYREDVYDCSNMSCDCEMLFESLGIHTLQIRGHSPFYNETHRWIMLDFGLVQIPYETTALAPINPEWFGYDIYEIGEGKYDGNKYAHQDASLVFYHAESYDDY